MGREGQGARQHARRARPRPSSAASELVSCAGAAAAHDTHCAVTSAPQVLHSRCFFEPRSALHLCGGPGQRSRPACRRADAVAPAAPACWRAGRRPARPLPPNALLYLLAIPIRPRSARHRYGQPRQRAQRSRAHPLRALPGASPSSRPPPPALAAHIRRPHLVSLSRTPARSHGDHSTQRVRRPPAWLRRCVHGAHGSCRRARWRPSCKRPLNARLATGVSPSSLPSFLPSFLLTFFLSSFLLSRRRATRPRRRSPSRRRPSPSASSWWRASMACEWGRRCGHGALAAYMQHVARQGPRAVMT